MIELLNVTVGYGKREIIKDLTFKAESGKITVILGKNGCGKSTLLRAVSGGIPYRGSILLDGEELRSVPLKSRARRIAVMPQILKSPDITVYELVSFGRQPYTGITGTMSENDKSRVKQLIADIGIGDLADKKINRISGGERQKAYFAMLMAQDTPNMLLDEPGAFLDAEYMNRLCDFLLCAKAAGKTALTVLHDINRAVELADKIVVLKDDGVFIGNGEEFAQSELPSRHFGLRRFEAVSENGEKRCFFH